MATRIWQRILATRQASSSRERNAKLHDLVETWKMRRLLLAKGWGLPHDYDVGTYPAVNTKITQNNLGSLLTAAVVGAGLVAGPLVVARSLQAPDPVEAAIAEPARKEVVLDYEIDEQGQIKFEVRDEGEEIPTEERE